MSTIVAPAARMARGVRAFDSAACRDAGEWEFSWRFRAEGDEAFEGHFPHQPILPGVFLVEMAQRAAEHALHAATQRPHRLLRVARFRFLGPVLPGDACRLLVRWNAGEQADGVRASIRFDREGTPLAQGDLWLAPHDAAPEVGDTQGEPQSAMRACGAGDIDGHASHASHVAGALQILAVMPHGHPMLLVDAAEEGAQADSAVAYKNITFNEPCYRDIGRHGDGGALAYPVSLLIESFGQGAGLLLARRGFLERAGSSFAVVFGEFEDIDLIGEACPGERLRHEVRLIDSGRTLAVLGGRTLVSGREIARYGRLKALLVPTQAIDRRAA